MGKQMLDNYCSTTVVFKYMKHPSLSISFFLQLAKTQNIVGYRFDRALGGLSLTEFLVLYQLEQAPNRQLSRIELAEQVGVTASGITKILLPMMKVHLIKDGKTSDDARVRSVEATAAGREKMQNEMDRLQFLVDELLPEGSKREAEAFINNLKAIAIRAGGSR